MNIKYSLPSALLLNYSLHKFIDYNYTQTQSDEKITLTFLFALIILISFSYIYTEQDLIKETMVITSILLCISSIMNLNPSNKELLIIPGVILSHYLLVEYDFI